METAGINKYNLSKRLSKVAYLVEPAVFLVDIGCDHGFLAIDLVKSGKVKKALCTDINDGPLERAKSHISEYSLDDKISTLKSDGLLEASKLEENDFDSCTICGMGGLMGIKIMFEANDYFRKMRVFYLQLQSDLELVRIYLKETGYEVLFEDMVFEDGKYYTVLKVKPRFDRYECFRNKLIEDLEDEGKDDEEADPFSKVRLYLINKYDSLKAKECMQYKYPFYEGEDEKVYREFLMFMINKYETIKGYLPEDSERITAVDKELEIMKLSFDYFNNRY